ncbi:kinesin-like protein Klp5 [Ascosphaera pollenicola]|nr:kinesin-like protein Klp5 [Ascosphaera pollenicola]
MAPKDGAASISVTVRVRPFTIREAAQLTRCEDPMLFLGDGSFAGVSTPKLAQKGIRPVIKVVDDRCLVFDPPEDNPMQRFSKSVVPNKKKVKDQTFMFDRVFDENTSQQDVYEATTRGLLDNVLDGYNATIFAYGATGCGKTHTITGTQQQPGIIFLAMQELFERMEEQEGEKITDLSLSYLEIYNETIRDLLVPGKANLNLREDANQSVSVAGLSTHHPKSIQEVMDMIMRGNQCRTQSPTDANATSSRSHAVLQINVAQRERNAPINEPHTMATLSIIDLAGSERASATKNSGERLFEGANINKSLLALGSCINALCDQRKHSHIPYRNSKLTRLLKFSLGGNCQTVMIVCVSPSSQHFDETQNTLRYANRAKNIQTKVTRNVYNVNRHVKDFLVKIDEQRALIDELKAQQKQAEKHMFTKFRKQYERKTTILTEGVARLKQAFENSAAERQHKIAYMIRLKQVERRIPMLSSWIAAFDHVCAARENDSALDSLESVRKTAQKILHELQTSRQHFQQKIASSNWERPICTALDVGLKQLSECELTEPSDVSLLTCEAENLKSIGERETFSTVTDRDESNDESIMQTLLQTNFEIMSAIGSMGHLTDEQIIESGKKTLSGLMSSCAAVASNIVQPDGKLIPIEPFVPSPRKTPRSASPKRRKARLSSVPVLQKSGIAASPAITNLMPPPKIFISPMKNSISPKKRRVALKKSYGLTPRKLNFDVKDSDQEHGPLKKPKKRSVRWKDDVEEGTLVEFQKTPEKKIAHPIMPERSTPAKLPLAKSMRLHSPPPPLPSVIEEEPSMLSPIPQSPRLPDFAPSVNRSVSLPSAIPRRSSGGSSREGSPPPPPVPQLSTEAFGKDSRFKAGFLTKRQSDASLPFTSLARQTISPSGAGLRKPPPLQGIGNTAMLNKRVSSSAFSQSSLESIDEDSGLQISKNDARKIGSAMRRVSSGNHSLLPHPSRRRNSISVSTSPNENGNNMFTTSQARRMVKSEKESDWKASVLSPRVAPITKSKDQARSRRSTTFADLRSLRENGTAGIKETPLRLAPTGLPGSAAGRRRISLANPMAAKNAWR